MTLFPDVHSTAILIFERLLFCFTAGTVLALILGLAMRFLPARNSHTRFAVWFSSLLALTLLPFAFMERLSWLAPLSGGHPLLTVPGTWAEYIALGWAVLASLGLLRVVFGLWQLRRLRRSCTRLDVESLGPEIMPLLEGCRRRPVELLVSKHVEVPTAIGFLHPAIVLPAWLVSDHVAASSPSAENLKYILFHELAHLSRWDDWTNLAQRLIKSILFFHPAVWWIERKLALDREMACDDVVIAQTESPRAYAQCLTSVAEKSFLRRQIALAQAAVSRTKQLSQRVAGIMDNRPRKTSVWKPAIPLVMVAAVLCGISSTDLTGLIGFGDANPGKTNIASGAHPRGSVISDGADPVASMTPIASSVGITRASMNVRNDARVVPAKLKYQQKASFRRDHLKKAIARQTESPRFQTPPDPFVSMASLETFEHQVPRMDDRQHPAQVVVLVVTSQSVNAAGASISAWELFVYVPAKQVLHKT